VEKLKIGYFADGKWAHNALRLLVNDSEIEVMFVCARFDSFDEELKGLSSKYNLNYLKHQNINNEVFLEVLEAYNCDLFVSMSFNQIFKSKIINMPKYGTINCHAGLLPYYRGRNVLNWVLINDEDHFGITVHYVDEGIDTGDIILQRSFPITDEDHYGSLLEIAYVECANILYDAVKLIKNDMVIPVSQYSIHPVGFYCGIRTAGDEIMNWNQSSREIFNFVRALSFPGPMARCFLNGKQLRINKVVIINDAIDYIGIPGQVVGKIDGKPVVKTKDNTILLKEFDYDGRIVLGDRLI